MTDPHIARLTPPLRADVTACYDRGVDTYDKVWGPVIRPPAVALVPLLGLSEQAVVLDVGAGTGALLDAIRSAAITIRPVALDASLAMSRHTRARGTPSLLADAVALPAADGTADGVILAYVLFHLSDPAEAVKESARVLRTGGRVGTVTWAWERGSRAHAVWDEVLAEEGIPSPPPRRVDAGLDRPEAIESLLRSAALAPERIWLERLRHRWTRESFWALASGSGVNLLRLSWVDPATRDSALLRAKDRLDRLAPDDFYWEGEVVCGVATKPHDYGPRCADNPGLMATGLADSHIRPDRAGPEAASAQARWQRCS